MRALRAAGPEEEFPEAAAAAMGEALRAVAGPAAAAALFGACDAVSGAGYEGRDAAGTLLLVARGHPCVEVLLLLSQPTPLSATRAARKALELSRGDVSPLCDGTDIWGLGRLARPYDPSREDL